MEILEKGQGELLAWCDPEEHREWVQNNKSLNLEDKVMDIKEQYRDLLGTVVFLF